MAKNKSQHFVPQHYLRNFRIGTTRSVAAAVVEPFYFIGSAPINTQCQQDYFYAEDGQLDELLQQSENDLAPVLLRVTQEKHFDSRQLEALKLLAVILRVRTRKAVEIAKISPRRIGYKIIKKAIESGDLPAPHGGWEEPMMDFSGIAGSMFKSSVIPCWLEMNTLSCKLLEACDDAYFITSDNPVITMNQWALRFCPGSPITGFSRSGFQLLLPVSPSLCLFFYDPKVYKIGSRKSSTVRIGIDDVKLINSLQLQFADRCIYFSNLDFAHQVQLLVKDFLHLRESTDSLMTEIPDDHSDRTLLHMKQPTGRLKHLWSFCTYKRHPKIGINYRRDPLWTRYVGLITEDQYNNPGRDVFESMEAILGVPLSNKNNSPRD